ncbi:hypothetical protein [Bradyrhizobium sp. CW1]|uniref:hypothetical protein n=1 Tax=Bradyrhizobium sp. CW1 TaxID=2782686 RepID=UPI001FFF3832|nr:hypothetical protein [Bradyrhizobium sp. CW1]UPJ27084.1 hypothetical protein IVB54_36675 [Bradyrhizobium sp. CW1]
MRDKHWPGIATAVAVLWIISTVTWLGIAGPIWRASSTASPDAWIGFAGNALGAGVALLAAIVAGIAAYRTIVPMQRQLSELVRQNHFAHYDKLRQRAADLVDTKILIENVTANLEVMDRSLSLSGLGKYDGRAAAFDRLSESVGVLNMTRRSVWGDENAQSLTTYFVDKSMWAVNVARCALAGSAKPFSNDEWAAAKKDAFQGGVALHARIKMETDVVSSEIAALEPVLLQRQPFPQLWKGEYPGPEKLSEMYSGKDHPFRSR